MNPSAVFAILALLTACGQTPPPCSDKGPVTSAPSAGCLVWGPRGALLVRGWSSGWALPGGSVADTESARCGAEREIFEETGMTATAGDLVKVFDNGFHLYWCEVSASAQPKIHRPLEVREVAWWQPEAVSAQAWRYPDQGAMIRDLVTARRLPATH